MSNLDFTPTSLFAYGTLAFPEVFEALTGREPEMRPAQLSGYRCRRLKDEPFAGIERCPGQVTEGMLIVGLTPGDLRLLDAFEDIPYRRRVVTVRPDSGPPVRAWAYVVPSHSGNLLAAEEWEPGSFDGRVKGDTLDACRRLRSRPPGKA